jgi:hypothetical protein
MMKRYVSKNECFIKVYQFGTYRYKKWVVRIDQTFNCAGLGLFDRSYSRKQKCKEHYVHLDKMKFFSSTNVNFIQVLEPVSWVVKECPAFYGTRRFIMVFTTARYWTLPEPAECSPHRHSIFLRSVLVLLSHLLLVLISVLTFKL